MKQIFLALAIFSLASCEESNKFHYRALDDVEANVLVSDVETTEAGDTLAHFKFEFKNNSKKTINFDVNKIEMLVNGKSPIEIHYNSLASNLWPNFVLQDGYSEHNLNVILDKEKLGKDETIIFIIINFGLLEND